MLFDPLRQSVVERNTDSGDLGADIIITIRPALDRNGDRLAGRFDAFYEGRLIYKASRAPFCDSARALQRLGIAPETTIILRHAGSLTDSLRSTVGSAAELSVREDRCGPRFSAWKAMPLRAVEAPIARPARAAPPHPNPGDGPIVNSRED
jgi:hypothetical protein